MKRVARPSMARRDSAGFSSIQQVNGNGFILPLFCYLHFDTGRIAPRCARSLLIDRVKTVGYERCCSFSRCCPTLGTRTLGRSKRIVYLNWPFVPVCVACSNFEFFFFFRGEKIRRRRPKKSDTVLILAENCQDCLLQKKGHLSPGWKKKILFLIYIYLSYW